MEFKIEINSDPDVLVLVRSLLWEIARAKGFDEEMCDKIVLAVDEACTNIIKHCYSMSKCEKIILICQLVENGINFKLKDFGPLQDCEKIVHRNLEEVKPGGLGVFFIKEIMDEVNYKHDEDGNVLEMFIEVKE